MFFPSSVRGPVENWEFRRLARVWAAVAMMIPRVVDRLECVVCTCISCATWYSRMLWRSFKLSRQKSFRVKLEKTRRIDLKWLGQNTCDQWRTEGFFFSL